jgi:hypothetical protein
MLDFSYADSPLVAEYVAPGVQPPVLPMAGTRYPDGDSPGGTRHQLLLFGNTDPAGVARLRDRWTGLVDVFRASDGASSSALLIRPDGYVGFRAIPADAAGLDAIDAHLAKYMIPGA